MVREEMNRDRFDMHQQVVYKQKQAYSRWSRQLGTRIAYKCSIIRVKSFISSA